MPSSSPSVCFYHLSACNIFSRGQNFSFNRQMFMLCRRKILMKLLKTLLNPLLSESFADSFSMPCQQVACHIWTSRQFDISQSRKLCCMLGLKLFRYLMKNLFFNLKHQSTAGVGRHEIRPIRMRYLISSLRAQEHQSGEVSLSSLTKPVTFFPG